jgi:hypothetical protein
MTIIELLLIVVFAGCCGFLAGVIVYWLVIWPFRRPPPVYGVHEGVVYDEFIGQNKNRTTLFNPYGGF